MSTETTIDEIFESFYTDKHSGEPIILPNSVRLQALVGNLAVHLFQKCITTKIVEDSGMQPGSEAYLHLSPPNKFNRNPSIAFRIFRRVDSLGWSASTLNACAFAVVREKLHSGFGEGDYLTADSFPHEKVKELVPQWIPRIAAEALSPLETRDIPPAIEDKVLFRVLVETLHSNGFTYQRIFERLIGATSTQIPFVLDLLHEVESTVA